MPNGRGQKFESMDDDTFLAAITPAMDSVLTAVFYRVLGQSSLPWNIKYIERFMKLSVDGKTNYHGEVVPILVNDRIHLYLWKKCDISAGHGLTTNIHVWGFKNGGNSVFTRKYWFKAYVIRSKIESSLNLQPMSLRLREYLI
jgi:hypothetical protein